MWVVCCRTSAVLGHMAASSRFIPPMPQQCRRGGWFSRPAFITVSWMGILVLTACQTAHPNRSEKGGTGQDATAPVPAVAPDTMPQALFDSLGLIRSPDGHGVPSVRSIVVISFKDNATQLERQAAVDAIHGVVVGGFRLIPVAKYYVRIPGTTFQAILVACRTVSALPQVEFAAPLMKEPPHGAGNPPMAFARPFLVRRTAQHQVPIQ